MSRIFALFLTKKLFLRSNRIKATLGLCDITVVNRKKGMPNDCMASYFPPTEQVEIPCLKSKGRDSVYRVELE